MAPRRLLVLLWGLLVVILELCLAPFWHLGGQVGYSEAILQPSWAIMWSSGSILALILIQNWFDRSPSKPLLASLSLLPSSPLTLSL